MAGYILLVCTVLLATLILQNSRQTVTVSAIKSALVIIGQALPIALAVFVLFPRIEAPRWLWIKQEEKGISGLTDTLEPGSISDLSLSDELVFRVRFDGELPPPGSRYWRGPVYSYTDGTRWSVPAANHVGSTSAEPAFRGKPYRYAIMLEPQKASWIFAMELAAQFDTRLHRNGLYQLFADKHPNERTEYRVASYSEYNTGKLSRLELIDSLQLPGPPSEKILALVRDLHGFDTEPEIFIGKLLQHFRDENFRYTLKPPLMLQKPLETFLFEARSGYCSHYATAFVYLMRTAKIPARVVGGYQGGEFNKAGGFLEIRQADAHAWAEVWLAGKGWVRYDPTAAIAPERIARGVNIDLQIASGEVQFGTLPAAEQIIGWLKYGRQIWQSIDYNWQRWVINYDMANQAQFLGRIGIRDWKHAAIWLMGCIFFTALILSGWLFATQKPSLDPVQHSYRRFCRKMAKTGVEIRLGEGARDFADRAKSARPDLAVQIERIAATYIGLRYHAVSQANDKKLLKKWVAELRV